jgi:hypothetical protein
MRREHNIQSGILPAGYRQLEYIERNGYQYIISNIIPRNEPIGFVMDFKFNEATNDRWFFGGFRRGECYPVADTKAFQLGRYGNKFYFALNDDSGNIIFQWYSQTADTNRHIFIFNKNGYGSAFDNVLISSQYNLVNKLDIPIMIFGRNSNYSHYQSNGFCGINSRLYNLEIFNSTDTISHFIPALRIADSKPGLYDIVNGQFYTNAGTGEFQYA